MNHTFRPAQPGDTPLLREIWNHILEEGSFFPGEEPYQDDGGFAAFLAEQSAVTCLLADGRVAGYYILHPNNIGRCGHVANASFAMSPAFRGRGLGKHLVARAVEQARELGFRGLQFNAVVVGNRAAVHLYQSAGFQTVGVIPGGFRLKDGTYSDMLVMYLSL